MRTYSILDTLFPDKRGSKKRSGFAMVALSITAGILPGSAWASGNVCPIEDEIPAVQGDSGDSCICTRIDLGSTFRLNCNLAGSTDTSKATATAVYDNDGALCSSGSNDFCLWGTDADGTDFFCVIDPIWTANDSEELAFITILGSSQDDTIAFQYDTDYDLDSWGSGKSVTGVQVAGDGNDYLIGSRSTNSDYTDDLSGESDVDTLCGYDGDDLLAGNDGNEDVLCGMNGDDTLRGGSGNGDYLDYGSPGSEYNDGGPGSGDQCNSIFDLNCEAGHSSPFYCE